MDYILVAKEDENVYTSAEDLVFFVICNMVQSGRKFLENVK